MKWNWRPLSVRCWHFEASEYIIMKFKLQALYVYQKNQIWKSWWEWKNHLCCFCNQLKELIFSTSGYGKSANDKNSNYEQKIDELQTDLNTTRVKLIEKEREVERLDAQVKTSAKSSPTAKGKLSRSGSQEEDLQKKIQVQGIPYWSVTNKSALMGRRIHNFIELFTCYNSIWDTLYSLFTGPFGLWSTFFYSKCYIKKTKVHLL